MDATDNCQTLQSMIDAQYLLVQADQTLLASLQAQKTALLAAGTQDVSSIANAGEGGNQNFTMQTVNTQLTDTAKRLREDLETLDRLMEKKNERFPWILQGHQCGSDYSGGCP